MKRSKYCGQTPNDLTGEYTAIMLKTLPADDLEVQPEDGWLDKSVLRCFRLHARHPHTHAHARARMHARARAHTHTHARTHARTG